MATSSLIGAVPFPTGVLPGKFYRQSFLLDTVSLVMRRDKIIIVFTFSWPSTGVFLWCSIL